MSPLGLSFLWMLVLRQAGPDAEVPSVSACPDRLRVDLSARTSVQAPEVCISPGHLTGFVFDRPASVDIQEEVRFGEVLRGRMGFSFVPPPGLSPGERLRLMVHFAQDPPDQSVTFTLVASPGKATHQVDVFHDARSRNSLWRELEEERLKNQQLRAENQSLQKDLTHPSALRRVFLSGDLTMAGIVSRPLPQTPPWSEQGSLVLVEGASFRTKHNLAVWLVLRNLAPEPWQVKTVSLTNEQGQPLKNVDSGQVRPVSSLGPIDILVTAPIEQGSIPTELTLTLRGEDSQSVTVPHLLLP